MKKVIISYDEWFPYYDIEEVLDPDDVSSADRVVTMSEDDYLVYKGLLLQMERLQNKLETIHNKRDRK